MQRKLIAAVAAALVTALALPTHAANIVDEWASVKAPAAPALKPVTVDPKTDALLHHRHDQPRPATPRDGRAVWHNPRRSKSFSMRRERKA